VGQTGVLGCICLLARVWFAHNSSIRFGQEAAMQSNRLAAAVFVAAFGIGVSAQGGAEKAELEFAAAFNKGDTATLSRLMTDDFTWVSASGRLQDKKTLVNGLQPVTGTPGKSVGIDVRPYAGGAVMVFTRQNPDGSQARILRLWVQRGNQWQLAAHQALPIGKPAAAATQPSSAMPPNSGPAAEIKAIEQAIAAVAEANRKGDPKEFAALVTDGFVAFSNTGEVRSKQQRMAEIQKAGPLSNPPVTGVETTTRIYGDLAVTTRANKANRQTIIHVKQGGKWLRAGIIVTPIATGK
jgi:ketosteroid isomerase-like protein